MNRWLVALGAFVISVSAPAQSPAEEFAWSWSLAPNGEAQVWRVRLGLEVMESLHLGNARDLMLTDANDRPIPFYRLPDRLLIEPLIERRALEAESTRISGEDEAEADLELVLRQDGARLVVRPRSAMPQSDAAGRLVFEALIGSPAERVDLHEHQLLLELISEQRLQLDCRLRDASDDRPATRRVRFAEAADSRPRQYQAGISVTDIPDAWHLGCYGRQAPDDLVLNDAVLESRGQLDHRRTEHLTPTVEPVEEMPGTFEFELDGPYRVRALHLRGAEGNLLSRIRVESHVDQGRTWRPRGQLTLSTLEQEISTLSLDEGSAGRDRYWRIHSDPALSLAPRIQVEVELDELMFLAQGQAPWTLYAGSRQVFGPAADNGLLARTTEQLGPAWRWPVIEHGPRAEAGGEAVLQPPPEPWPWQRYLLWLLLFAGTLMVFLLAFRLLSPP